MGIKMEVSSTNTDLKMWSINGCETADFIGACCSDMSDWRRRTLYRRLEKPGR